MSYRYTNIIYTYIQNIYIYIYKYIYKKQKWSGLSHTLRGSVRRTDYPRETSWKNRIVGHITSYFGQ